MVWDDGHTGPVSLRRLRDACPCAGCMGETVLLRTFTPPPRDTSAPGRYELKGAVPVGNYALQFRWADPAALDPLRCFHTGHSHNPRSNPQV